MRSRYNLSSVNVHNSLEEEKKKKDIEVEAAMLEQKLTKTKVLHEVARHLRCIVAREPPLAEGGSSIWHLEDASTHEEMRWLAGNHAILLHGFTKPHLLDTLLEIADKLVTCSMQHQRENPFFGCKNLEEVMIRCDLLDAAGSTAV